MHNALSLSLSLSVSLTLEPLLFLGMTRSKRESGIFFFIVSSNTNNKKCKYPGCAKPVWPGSDFCGKMHLNLFRQQAQSPPRGTMEFNEYSAPPPPHYAGYGGAGGTDGFMGVVRKCQVCRFQNANPNFSMCQDCYELHCEFSALQGFDGRATMRGRGRGRGGGGYLGSFNSANGLASHEYSYLSQVCNRTHTSWRTVLKLAAAPQNVISIRGGPNPYTPPRGIRRTCFLTHRTLPRPPDQYLFYTGNVQVYMAGS